MFIYINNRPQRIILFKFLGTAGNIIQINALGVVIVTVPFLLLRIERMRRRLQYMDNPEKRLKLSQELDKLLNQYYRMRMNAMGCCNVE